MKRLPIIYRQRYSNDDCGQNGEILQGFTQIRTEAEVILERFIEAEPTQWNHGYAIIFRLGEVFFDRKPADVGRQERILIRETQWVYDKDMNSEDRAILYLLCEGEYRGTTAESIINRIMVKYYLTGIKEFLPEVFAWWEEQHNKYPDLQARIEKLIKKWRTDGFLQLGAADELEAVLKP
jgi:hypothetical protein